MRLTCLGLIALLLVLTPGRDRSALAGEDPIPAGMSEDEARSLRGKLRSRAGTWWRHRKNLAIVCPQCKGAGKVRWRRGRRYVQVDCPKCDGNKIRVDKDAYRICYYDMRSPAFRLQERIQARVTQEYVKARDGSPFPEILKRYTIKRVEIVDFTHGVVHVALNKDTVARPQRWILVKEGNESGTWHFYDEGADGPWAPDEAPVESTEPEPDPESATPPAEEPPTPTVEPEPERPEPPPANRVGIKESRRLIETWTTERNELDAGVIRIQLGLGTVKGHEETVATAHRFIEEIKGWIAEAKPAYDRAVAEVEMYDAGLRLEDRLKVNTLHFKASRRIELVEKMLIGILPDLRKQ